MISVQMAYENVMNAVEPYLMFQHTDLGSFPAINQKQILIIIDYLRSMMPSEGKRC
jgi:hypothetical protein